MNIIDTDRWLSPQVMDRQTSVQSSCCFHTFLFILVMMETSKTTNTVKTQILDKVKELYDFKNSFFVGKDLNSLSEKRDDAVDKRLQVCNPHFLECMF